VTKRWKILIVDDERVMRESMAAWLREDGYPVDTAASGQEAIGLTRERDYAMCFVDLKMPPGMDGIETMMELRKIRPEASVIIITAYATVDTAITAMKEGASEYIVKPCSPEEISLLVQRIVKVKNIQRENTILRKKLSRQYEFQDILSKNPRMQEIFELIRRVGPLRSTVLIQGESGTGKEMIARAIHHCGGRSDRPFVAVSCAALAETLLESEMFGHERGAFTGAVARKRGKFELADGGTIFLDEIGEISPKLQLDLLRVLQERRFFRVGGTEEVSVDVRVIAATKVDLQEAVLANRFRDDLFYRLNVISIRVPPLRDRREDVPLLARHFLDRLSLGQGKEVTDLTEGALRILLAYDWPGNVRELENTVERAIVSTRERVLTDEDFGFLHRETSAPAAWKAPTGLRLHEVERRVIEATLRRAGGNVTETAEILGIDRSTLYDKMHRYGIARSSPAEAAAVPDALAKG
jgi:DNA-binding NtrC family response regulator